ncbi:MAG: hypothetical protein F6K28_34520, partial [Microcoleus sp. SIO2G3]|nr:hypothetical protein [Microcoleus sp. SIO2G3]
MASGRYRSQIFNAFSRQSRRLSDRLAQTWRQAKLTATWGTQILLYPIYALYQGTRVVSRQIGQTVQRILPQLQPASETDPANLPLDELSDLDAPVDMPIVRSIAALSGLELSSLSPILPAADGAMTVAAATPIVVVELPGAIAPDQETALETATVRVRGIA